jgi:excinuclease ABC subunit A
MVDLVLAQPEGERWMLLAPVINDRKGEHVLLLEDLKAQGFLRARIDGEIYELDEPPALDLKKKHTIEVIVDRFKIRDDMALRLAESFETALRLSDGLAIAASMDNDQQLLFSERYACPHCGYSLSELEPRIFSFNNPKGACPSCDGLGVRQTFDPQLVVHNPEISLAGGAVRGWDRRNAYYYQIICALAEHYGFDPEAPFSSIPKSVNCQRCPIHCSIIPIPAFIICISIKWPPANKPICRYIIWHLCHSCGSQSQSGYGDQK